MCGTWLHLLIALIPCVNAIKSMHCFSQAHMFFYCNNDDYNYPGVGHPDTHLLSSPGFACSQLDVAGDELVAA